MSEGADSPQKIVARGYDQVAAEYARLEEDAEWPRMRWLGKLLQQLDAGSAVLDLGCGSGDPADVEIAARGHAVTGVDISGEQIARARENVPAGRFVHGDAASAAFPAASFDAVISFYALEHVPRDQHGALYAGIHHWLRERGWLLICTEASEAQEGAQEGVGEWLGVPMYFSFCDPETVKAMIQEAGFEIVETAIETQVEQGVEIPYLWVLGRKRARGEAR
jgi:ubiquinone/menaquinone biosynthesis C-methylase UbiE